MPHLGLVTVVVPDYDEAIAFYVHTLGFELREDTPLEEGKRWLVVAPRGSRETGLLLARAAAPEQRARIGDQTGGRVGWFLDTADFDGDYARMRAAGVLFEEAPRDEEFDTRGNCTAVIAPDGATTRYAYDPTGSVATVTDALGAKVRITNSPAGLPLTHTDALGAETNCTRDAFGRPVVLADALGATTQLEWTVEGQPARRVSPDGSAETWTWDGEGNCLSSTDPNGGLTRSEYTHFDLLAVRTGADGVRYEFAYDTELRLTQVTNPQGLTWEYAYDRAGRLVTESDFDDREISYAYDAAGQLSTRTTPLGNTLAYQRDSLGRVVAKDAAGALTTYAYDDACRLVQATAPSTSLDLDFDVVGRLLAETIDGRTTRYTYDELGRRTSRITPSGAVSTSTYDDAGSRTSVSADGHRLDFAHDANGREIERTFGDVMVLTSAWDPLGRLVGQNLVTNSRIQRARSYGYRPDSNLTSIAEEITGLNEHVELDPIGRPLTVTADGWSESYAYDSAGNQTTAAWPEQTGRAVACGERVYSGTRIVSAGGVRYEHDAAGRMTLRQKTRLSRKPDTWRYEWDAEDRLIACTTPDGTCWTYSYDALGRRTAKYRMNEEGSPVEATYFTWDGTRLAEQHDTTTGVMLTWDHEGHRPLTQYERKPLAQGEVDSRFFAIVTDLVGTPTELVDEHGDIAWHTRSTLWGTTTWNRDATAYTAPPLPRAVCGPRNGPPLQLLPPLRSRKRALHHTGPPRTRTSAESCRLRGESECLG